MALIEEGAGKSSISFEEFQEAGGVPSIRNIFGRDAAGVGAANTFIKSLQNKAIAGEISVDEFLSISQPLAQQNIDDIRIIAGQGSAAASSINPQVQALREAGFVEQPGGQVSPVNLPQSLQLKARESLVPENLDPEARQRIIESIPSDIQFGTDRFEIERERIRQQVEAEQQLEQRGIQREEQLTGLEDLLRTQQERAFREATPILTEQLQTRGLLQTSELESAFGREQARLTGAASDIIAGERLRAGELGIGEELDIQEASRRFQSQGLERQFSLADFQREAQIGRQLAELSKPTQRGKGKGEKALGIAQGVGAIGGLFAGGRGGGAKPPVV